MERWCSWGSFRLTRLSYSSTTTRAGVVVSWSRIKQHLEAQLQIRYAPIALPQCLQLSSCTQSLVWYGVSEQTYHFCINLYSGFMSLSTSNLHPGIPGVRPRSSEATGLQVADLLLGRVHLRSATQDLIKPWQSRIEGGWAVGTLPRQNLSNIFSTWQTQH